MVPPSAVRLLGLLSLLGAGALAAGVYSAPVEKDDRVEEMVTRCIVEVLLNGLSKASAPPINPQCKELLKKSNRQKEQEHDGPRDLEPSMIHFSDLEKGEKPQEESVRKEQDRNEEEFKRQAEVGAKGHPEGRQYGGKENLQAISQGDSSSFEEAHKEETKADAEKRTEEDGSSKRNYPIREESKAKKHSEDLELEFQDKKPISPSGKLTEHEYKRSGGQREEIMHSQERENEESKEEEDAEEEEEEESSEKYHHSFHREYEDSSEREDDTDKRGHKPRHYYRKPRLGSSSEFKRQFQDEKDSPEESSEEEHGFWDKRGHSPKHYYETAHPSEEKRNSAETYGSEETEGKSRSKEHQDKWHLSKEESEEEDMRRHSRENEEKQHHLERKRLPGEPQKELSHGYEEHHNKPNEEDVGEQLRYGNGDEKRNRLGKEHLQLELEEMPKLQNIAREYREQRFHSPEGGERESKRHHPPVIEEELEERHHNERGKHLASKRTLLLEEGYPRSHYLVENVKRAVAPFIPYYQQFRWKNRHAEKREGVGNPFLESDEEPRSQLNERDFFPEYNDYDLWEKKQRMDGLSHKHTESNNQGRSHKLDVKRQYNKMDQLAHLLSNRKKSTEFPEVYSSREDVKRGPIIRSGEGKLRQRPLTHEEEKELENLAAMDLELQKIAEKFNSNHRG